MNSFEKEYNEDSLHCSIMKGVKALSDWLILPDNKDGSYIVRVEIKKKEI